jgi:hypothetical protein
LAALLAVLVAAAFLIGRETLRARYLALGFGCVAVLYAPYIWYLFVEGFVYEPGNGPGLGAVGRFATSLRDTLTVGADDRISHLLGTHSATAFPVSLVFGIVSAVGLAASCRGWRESFSER